MKSTLEEREFAEMEVTLQSWNPTWGSPAFPINAPLPTRGPKHY